MNIQRNNNILKRSLLGLFVLFMVLAPISTSFTSSTNSVSIEIYPQLGLAKEAPAEKKSEASVTSLIGGFGSGVIDGIGNMIGTGFMNAAAGITATAGKLLDYALDELVFGMSERVNAQSLGNTIDVVWKLIRDICNLAFIFGFIYIGIRTIIDPDSSDVKKFLSRIIIGALLINFSLFFVKIIIDFSNFTAFQIYKAMTTGTGSITETIANNLGIVTFYNATDGKVIETLLQDISMWFFIMGTIFLLITAFVFLAAAVLLIIRFVTLILIMVGSPILFAATVFPQTEHFASDLWKKLISNAFFAPAYLLLTLMSITLIQGVNIAKTGAGFDLLLTDHGGAGGVSVVLNFIVIIFFMISSLTIAQKLGVYGSDMVVSKTKTLIGAGTAGLAARTGRVTLGQIGHRVSENENRKDRASQSGARGWIARQQIRAGRAVGDTSFDARNINGVGEKIGIGAGRKGGYKTVLHETEKKEMEFAKSLGEVNDDDPRFKQRKDEVTRAKKEVERLKNALEDMPNTTDEERRERGAVRTEIKKAEEVVKDKEYLAKQEEQRRILGSTFTEEQNAKDTRAKKEVMDPYSKRMKELSDEILNTTDLAKRVLLRDEFKKTLQRFKSAEKEYVDSLTQAVSEEVGYAKVLEHSNHFQAGLVGRTYHQEHEAGEEIRKAYEKKIKKSEEDKRNDKLLDKLGSINNSSH